MTMACCVVITAVASSSEVAVETQHPCGTSGAPPETQMAATAVAAWLAVVRSSRGTAALELQATS